MHYGCPSPKPLQFRSNWPHVSKLDMGKLAKSERERLTTIQTTRRVLTAFVLCVTAEAARAKAGVGRQR